MSKNITLADAVPKPANMTEEAEPMEGLENQIFVPVKFNKQVLNLDLEKAQGLAQKGMKFDVISKDYLALKELAAEEGKSVGDYIAGLKSLRNARREKEILEKCGGDKAFAEHILKLEESKYEEVKGFSELKDNFPKINAIKDLPDSVVEAAKLKGTLLLDEYLRYLHSQDIAAKSSIKEQRDAKISAMGSLSSRKGGETPETAEFLRGLWQK